jgi:hypothetical protein
MAKSVSSTIFSVMKAIAATAIAVLTVLACVAQILAFHYDHPNVMYENVRNVYQYVSSPDASAKCQRFEQRFEKVDCEQKATPAERMLCKVTVPPVKSVCVDEITSSHR